MDRSLTKDFIKLKELARVSVLSRNNVVERVSQTDSYNHVQFNAQSQP